MYNILYIYIPYIRYRWLFLLSRFYLPIAAVRINVCLCLSVRLCVTIQYCVETAKQILLPLDSPVMLIFRRYEISTRNHDDEISTTRRPYLMLKCEMLMRP